MGLAMHHHILVQLALIVLTVGLIGAAFRALRQLGNPGWSARPYADRCAQCGAYSPNLSLCASCRRY